MNNDVSITALHSDPVAEALGEVSPLPEIEISQDDIFSYDGYQVVRGEFFAHVYEPSIAFNNCKVYVNTACISKLPNVDYVQILVNPDEKKLAIRPCNEDEKDSFLWCNSRNGKRKPKGITCRVFFAKIVQMMGWNSNYRYKLLGKLIRSGDEHLFVFDLAASEIFQRIVREGEKTKTSRTPVFPVEWQNQFGLPVEEHRKSLQVNIFEGYAVFSMKDELIITDSINGEQPQQELEASIS